VTVEEEKGPTRIVVRKDRGFTNRPRLVTGSADLLQFPREDHWRRKPGVWDGRIRLAGCVDWNRVLGLVTMIGVSAVGWIGLAAIVIHFWR
jgi:hypothetical protein